MPFDPQIYDAAAAIAKRNRQSVLAAFAERPLEEWSSGMAAIAHKALKWHRKELAERGIDYDKIEPPENGVKIDGDQQQRTITVSNGNLSIALVSGEKYFDLIKSDIKRIRGRQWDADAKCWLIPMIKQSMIQTIEFSITHDFDFDGAAREAVSNRLEKLSELSRLSNAKISDFEIDGLGGELLLFQRAGVEYAVAAKRCFIADQMGLGKTVQALAAIEKLDVFPALVVCPATLKLNWKNEARKWLPKRSAFVIDSRGADDLTAYSDSKADITIVNYDLLACWERDERGEIIERQVGRRKMKIPEGLLAKLIEAKFKAVIFDESHYLKSSKAQRTEAAEYLVENIDHVFMLTGTPVLNRPSELIAPLRIMGRLDEFGGWYGYATRYCGAHKGRFGWDLSGATNLDELNEELRSRCYVRRLKSEVLDDLPEKRRARLDVDIDNRSEYDDAERNLIAWLIEQVERDEEFMLSIAHLSEDERRRAISKRKSSKAMAALRAEQLIRINALKTLAARGKLKTSITWIENFVESGEKLIVFADHVEMQKKIAKAFKGCARIFGNDSTDERQTNVDRFQDDHDCRLIVCSLGAGGLGWTGTAASNMLFVEQGWTPAIMDQAEDRAHRIGQKSSVTAWYMIGVNTIDEDISELIERKRKIVDAATDGGEKADVSIMKELVSRLILR